MDELLGGLMTSFLDDGSFGIDDGGIVISINGMTAYLKDEIESHDWNLKWLYPFLPYVCAFIMGYLTHGDLIVAAKGAAIYGTAATATYRLHKDTSDHLKK